MRKKMQRNIISPFLGKLNENGSTEDAGNDTPDEKITAKGALGIAGVSQEYAVKRKSAKTYAELAQETGLPNVYVAQILKCQALLSPEAACMLRTMPGLPEDLVLEMMEPPRRSYDPLLIQDPAIYR
ncbi:hypothetical protein RJ639_021254 [Escallonia herrerae]|uniref:Uncharacterized protein n=1 Tax=Escallonia herrerae TaxID=1293975 RepID=A0AA88V663_9ASTE|nr:hypothetical protein RJ639_021254 [Escallonia herrerae]